ncbi:MAG: membrane protein insertion efficiency factor YidD [Dehalococcoidia bacterium]
MRQIAIGAIRIYQKTISRVTPPTCRFVPSCSQYGVEAIEKHGVLRGVSMTVWRIARCNPFSAGGYDPVP